VLPSFNEWYKAAYYNPTDSTYYDYANGSNTVPVAVASGTTASTAVYNQSQGPADVDQAGGLSPYGVMGLNGNVWDWEESSIDLLNSTNISHRAIRGGQWMSTPIRLSSSSRDISFVPNNESNNIGFRVAMVEPIPEPSMMVIGTLFGLGGLMAKRRMKK
jgi:formylglycine-generating enzyme required for sulfatase activity